MAMAGSYYPAFDLWCIQFVVIPHGSRDLSSLSGLDGADLLKKEDVGMLIKKTQYGG